MEKRLRRRLAAIMAAAMAVGPAPGQARVLPTIIAPTQTVTVGYAYQIPPNQCLTQGGTPTTNPANGLASSASQDNGQTYGSPALVAAPVFNSGGSTMTVWGLGWTSTSDQFAALSPNLSVSWTNGSGAVLTFFNAAPSTATPSYIPPVNSFMTMTATAMSGGAPTVLQERDKDGTTRQFSVFDSTTILRLSLLTDRNGNTVTYSRDGYGRLTTVTDVHGRYFELTYTTGSFVATLTDSGGRTSSYSYDPQGHMTSVAGPLGTTSYQYDTSNRMTKITYPNGGVHDYTYDSSNRVLTEDDGSGQNALSYAYGASSTTVTDALGRETVYQYISQQGLQKPVSITDPYGHVTSYTYDANFNVASMTDPLGRVTLYAYDANGNVTATRDAALGLTQATYDPTFSLPLTQMDPLYRTTVMSYDGNGNLTQVQDPLYWLTKNGYDTFGHMTNTQDPLTFMSTFTYASDNGALASATDPLNHTTSLQTDMLSRVVASTDPTGQTTQYQYDAAGNMTQTTDALLHVTTYTYAAGRTSLLLSTATDANGNRTSFGYDAQGRQTSVTNALSQTKTSAYDAKSNLIQTTNARVQVSTYTYDDLDRLTAKTLPEGQINYGYDAAGNQLSANSYNGSSSTNTYDALNRLIQTIQTLPNGYSVTIGYSYDAASNRTGMSTPWGNFSYTYDALNRLTSITNPQGKAFTFAYDANGRRTSLAYPNGIVTNYTYDHAGQALSIISTRTSDGLVVSSEAYTYDAAGDRTSMTDVEGTHSYGYDNLHRLTSATHPPATVLPIKNETFSYDAVGNRLADAAITGYTYNAGNELTSNSSFTYTYDADGNQTGKTDLASNQSTFTFNSQNQLSTAAISGVNWTYLYDAKRRRVEKSSGTAAGQTVYYVYDNQNILAMLDSSNNPIIVFTNSLQIDEPLLIHRSDTDYGVHADALGSIRVYSSTAGANAEDITYQAYGAPVFADVRTGTPVFGSSSITGSPDGFAGTPFDPESGHYLNRLRYLDPFIGRFLAIDSLSGSDTNGVMNGSSNLYQYAYNSPTRYIDPNGTSPVVLLGAPAWAEWGLVAITVYTAWGAYINSTWQNGVLTIPPTSQWNKSSFWFTPAIPIPFGFQWDTNQKSLWKIGIPNILYPPSACPASAATAQKGT